jgi:glyoxylase-like metal-dependent hydrolase (beta-lactamase superfamily II)
MTGAAPLPPALEVVPGLWRVRLPFHLELNHVNVHLVQLAAGWMLVDCGVATRESQLVLDTALSHAGIGWPEIKTVLITHCHPDHVGNLISALERSGACLLMHAKESELLAHISQSVEQSAPFDSLLPDWGTPPELVQAIQAEMAGSWRQFHWRQPDVLLQGGEILDSALGKIEVIHTPGHARGHLCLYFRGPRILISGDHLLPDITPNIGWMPGADPLADYLTSLTATGALDVDLALPSHGDPFHDPRRRAVETEAHHDNRCRELLRALNGGPRTPYELTLCLWGNRLSPFQHRFGLYEVMAHLEYLERRGRVRTIGELSARRYVVTDGGTR